MTGEEAMKLNGIYYRIPALYDSGIVSLQTVLRRLRTVAIIILKSIYIVRKFDI